MPDERSVLIVDDEPQIRRVVRSALSGEVGRVLEAENGRQGIDAAAAERPSLIVLDLGLPDMDGTAVIARLRSWSDAPIIVLSGRAQPTLINCWKACSSSADSSVRCLDA